MRDARGTCRVPSAAQRRASGFWCRAVESSTAFSHDDRSPCPLADNVPVHPAFRLNALMVYVALVVDVLVGPTRTSTTRPPPQMDVMALIFQACAFLLTTMLLQHARGDEPREARDVFQTRARVLHAPLPRRPVLRLHPRLAFLSPRAGVQLVPAPANLGGARIHGAVRDDEVRAVVYYCAVVWSMQRLCTRPNSSPRNRVIWRSALNRRPSG